MTSFDRAQRHYMKCLSAVTGKRRRTSRRRDPMKRLLAARKRLDDLYWRTVDPRKLSERIMAGVPCRDWQFISYKGRRKILRLAVQPYQAAEHIKIDLDILPALKPPENWE